MHHLRTGLGKGHNRLLLGREDKDIVADGFREGAEEAHGSREAGRLSSHCRDLPVLLLVHIAMMLQTVQMYSCLACGLVCLSLFRFWVRDSYVDWEWSCAIALC